MRFDKIAKILGDEITVYVSRSGGTGDSTCDDF